MFDELIGEIKKLDNELNEISKNINFDKCDEKNQYLYAKFTILYGKFLTKELELINNYSDFKKEKIKWLIRSWIIIILCNINMFLNISTFSFLLLIFGNVFATSVLLSDLIKDTKCRNSIKECKNNIRSHELYKQLSYVFKSKKNTNLKDKDKDLFDKALDVILCSLYYNNVEIENLTDDIRVMMIKILQSDLETEENDLEYLLSMAREKNKVVNPTLELKR